MSHRDTPESFNGDLDDSDDKDLSLYRVLKSSEVGSRESIRKLVAGWLRVASSPEGLIKHAETYRTEGWHLITSNANFDRVLLSVADSSWDFAISELLTTVAYYQASISQFDLALVHRPDIENAESLLMLDSLEDLFRKVSELNGSNMTSIGLVYLGWFLNLALDFLSEKISSTEFVSSTTKLTTHFNHQVVAMKSVLMRQSLPQILTSRASVFLPK